jgi:hypothetical protein
MKFIKGKETFIMYFLVSVDSNMEANLATVLSAVSDYCMGCFFRKRKMKSDTVVALRRCGYAKSLDVFGTSESNAPL